MRRRARPASAAKVPSGPLTGMWPMRRPLFVPSFAAIISSSREQGAIEEHRVGAGNALGHRRGQFRGAGNKDEPCTACGKLDADIGLGLGRKFRIVALEIKRDLAGNEEKLGLDAPQETQIAHSRE